MGQKSPIQSMWDMARSGVVPDPKRRDDESAESKEIAKRAARIRSRVDQSGIGDGAVYDETQLPSQG